MVIDRSMMMMNQPKSLKDIICIRCIHYITRDDIHRLPRDVWPILRKYLSLQDQAILMCNELQNHGDDWLICYEVNTINYKLIETIPAGSKIIVACSGNIVLHRINHNNCHLADGHVDSLSYVGNGFIELKRSYIRNYKSVRYTKYGIRPKRLLDTPADYYVYFQNGKLH